MIGQTVDAGDHFKKRAQYPSHPVLEERAKSYLTIVVDFLGQYFSKLISALKRKMQFLFITDIVFNALCVHVNTNKM